MKNKIIFFPTIIVHLLLILSVPGTIYAQNKSSVSTKAENGLQKVTFETPNGTVEVNLPEEIWAGDVISGTVISKPEGKKEKQITKNSSVLNGYVVEIKEKKKEKEKEKDKKEKKPEEKKINQAKVTNGLLKSIIPVAGSEIIHLILKDKKGVEIASTELPVVTDPPVLDIPDIISTKDFSLPAMIQSGSPASIAGTFDSDFENTRITIGDEPATLLAESPRQVFFEAPENITGPRGITLEEGDVVVTGDVNSFRLNLSAEKLKLTRGESTEVHLQLEGLNDLPSDIPVEIRNLTPDIVNIDGGNNQTISVNPDDVADDGTYATDLHIVSTTTGRFSIAVTAKPPAPYQIKIISPENLETVDQEEVTFKWVPIGLPRNTTYSLTIWEAPEGITDRQLVNEPPYASADHLQGTECAYSKNPEMKPLKGGMDYYAMILREGDDYRATDKPGVKFSTKSGLSDLEVLASLYQNELNYINRTALNDAKKSALNIHLSNTINALKSEDLESFNLNLQAYNNAFEAIDNPALMNVSSGKPGGFASRSLYCKDCCDHHLRGGDAVAYATCFWSCMACLVDKTTSVSVPENLESSAILSDFFDNEKEYIGKTRAPAEIKSSLQTNLSSVSSSIASGDLAHTIQGIESYHSLLGSVDQTVSLEVSNDKPSGFWARSTYCKECCDHHLRDGDAVAYATCFWSCMACIIDKGTGKTASADLEVLACMHENELNYLERTALPAEALMPLQLHLTNAINALHAQDVVTYSKNLQAYHFEFGNMDTPELMNVSSGKPDGFASKSLYCKDCCDHHLKGGDVVAYATCFWSCMACLIDKTTSVSVPEGAESSAVLSDFFANEKEYIGKTRVPATVKNALQVNLSSVSTSIASGDLSHTMEGIESYHSLLGSVDQTGALEVSGDKPSGFWARSTYCKECCDHHLRDGDAVAYATCFWSCMACIIDKGTGN